MEHLLRRYRPIDAKEVVEKVRHGEPLPSNGFVLTFDDGYREMVDVVAPRLLHHGVPATFFVNTAFIDNHAMCYLNKASVLVERVRDTGWSTTLALGFRKVFGQRVDGATDACSQILSVCYADRCRLDEIAAILGVDCEAYLKSEKPYVSSVGIRRLIGHGFSVGAHSIDHPLYAQLPIGEQLRQTIESVRAVRTAFRLDYGLFAFPHSDMNVGLEFFAKLGDTRLVDVSFGTAGLLDDPAPRNLQRISLEQPLASAERIIRFHYARRLARVATGRGRIARI